MTEPRLAAPLPRYFWFAWAAVLGVTLAVHLGTLTLSPIIWQDEVSILDFGRVVLDPQTDWSFNWFTDRDQPVFWLPYVGATMQEAGFRLGGASRATPRLASVLGALVAATLVLFWLRGYGFSNRLALVLGVAFLLDPLIVQSYRGARVDVWAIVACLGAMCLIPRSGEGAVRSGPRHAKWMAAGALAALSVFIWPSSIILFPLLLAELAARSRPTFLAASAKFAVGGLLTTVLLLLPIREQLFAAWEAWSFATHLRTNGAAETSELAQRLLAMVGTYKLSPVLPLAALIGASRGAERRMIWATLGAIVVALVTNPYVHRLTYLTPYLLILTGGLLTHGNRRLSRSIEASLVAWAIVVSLVGRPVKAMMERNARDSSIVDRAARIVGRGDHAVWLQTWEFYYAGRELGWKMYGPYFAGDPDRAAELFDRIDFVVLSSKSDGDFASDLSRQGWRVVETSSPRLGESGYGPYLICQRPNRPD